MSTSDKITDRIKYILDIVMISSNMILTYITNIVKSGITIKLYQIFIVNEITTGDF